MENRLDEIHGKNRTTGEVKSRNTKKKVKPINGKKKRKLNGNRVVPIEAEKILIQRYKDIEERSTFNHNKRFFRGIGNETAPPAVEEVLENS